MFESLFLYEESLHLVEKSIFYNLECLNLRPQELFIFFMFGRKGELEELRVMTS